MIMRRRRTLVIGLALALVATLLVVTMYTTLMGERPIETIQAKMIEILREPEKYHNRVVLIEGKFMGWYVPKNLTGPPISTPPVTRSDWVIADDTGWIYVSATSPARCSLKPFSREDVGAKIIVKAVVKLREIETKEGTVKVPYLYALECIVLKT